MIMDDIKRSFDRVKEDIFFLGDKIEKLNFNLQEVSNQIKRLDIEIERLKIDMFNFNQNQPKNIPTHFENNQTQKTPSKNNLLFQALKPQILASSTGNRGVPTDRQTNQQTDKTIRNIQNIIWRKSFEVPKYNLEPKEVVGKEEEDSFDKAIKILDNLDTIKKDIRNKFKRLTEQEFKVFSSLYLLEEKGLLVDYKLLAEKLALTESSIRDYVGKLINKGIPITKEKINNKQIVLHISKDLKEITPLDTISRLRDI
jgi:hypothetical protein